MPSDTPNTTTDPSSPTSRAPRPIPRSTRQPQASPNFDNLSALSESSTGSWEKGRLLNSTRSPTSGNMPLPDLAKSRLSQSEGIMNIDNDTSQQQQSSSLSVNAEPIRPNHINLPLAPIYPRQQREGYGFRPTSGQTTPTIPPPMTGSSSSQLQLHQPGSSSSSAQFGSASTNARARARQQRGDDDGENEDEERDARDDYDHMPDGQSMEALREGIKGELIKSGIVGTSSGQGIADEEGLGWPGKST